MDNIYLAESHIPPEADQEGPTSPDSSAGQTSQAWKVWIKGFNGIKNQLCDFLAKEGIEPVETVGKPFDPNLMESVGEVPADAEGSGVVKEEVQRGYTMAGKIIRVAKVKISK